MIELNDYSVIPYKNDLNSYAPYSRYSRAHHRTTVTKDTVYGRQTEKLIAYLIEASSEKGMQFNVCR